MRVLSFIAVALIAATFLLSSNASVINLTSQNFKTTINSSNPEHATFIKFFAPWCGFCKKIAPTWIQLADSAAFDVAEVDCTIEKQLCADFGIKGYPTLIVVKGDQYGEFNGGRDLDALLDAVASTSTTKAVEISEPPTPFEVFMKEITHDLNEIWDIRRNALGLIVFTSFLAGIFFTLLCCGGKKEKVTVKEKKD